MERIDEEVEFELTTMEIEDDLQEIQRSNAKIKEAISHLRKILAQSHLHL